MGFREFAGKISDAIPNEMSKTNSFSKYASYIPYIGPALKLIWNAGSGLDRFGETYSNGGGLVDSAQYGMSAFQGTAGDPNKYSEKNNSLSDADWWLRAGEVGEMLPGGYDSGSSGSSSGFNLGGLSSMFGSGSSSGGGSGSSGGMDMNSILNLASSLSSMFGGGKSSGDSGGGMPNLEFADGSGRYLSGNSPSSGSFVDGKFLGDLVGMFGQGGGMSPQMPSGGMDPNSFDWSNILKMLGSAGTMGSGAEQAQPTMGGMVPRLPASIAPVIPQATKGEGYYQTWLRQNNLS